MSQAPHIGARFASCAGIGVIALMPIGIPCLAEAPTATAPVYYYFAGEAAPLDLDHARLGVRFKADLSGAGRSVQIEDMGLDVSSIERIVADRWVLLNLSEPMTDATDARALLDALADRSEVEFVSPVFHGRDGGWVLVTSDILLRMKSDHTDELQDVLTGDGPALQVVQREFGNFAGGFILRSSARNGFDVLDKANVLAQDGRVLWAEPDTQFTGRGSLIPNDPGFGWCWGIRNTAQFGGIADTDMDGDQAWDVTIGSSDIKVLVLDTGVQQDHPDINQLAGADFTGQAGSGGPVHICDNHGTAVSGCISAIINNNLGTVGIAPGCKVLSARPFISTSACDGLWTSRTSWIVNAIAWGSKEGARVSNDSNHYGGLASSAINAIYSSTRAGGMIHFASAGNSAEALITYPSSLNSVNSVASLTPDGNLAFSSNWGVGLAFSAPGESIYTTDRTGAAGWVSGDYVFANGTSFASAYAAGIAALVLSNTPTLNVEEVETIMRLTTVDLGAPGYDTTYGWGLLNARAAVNFILDCNGNGIADSDDIASGTSTDCNENRIPDDCEPLRDCNDNAVLDACDIAFGTSSDCDDNGIPDECEDDTDGDGVIDICDPCPADNPDDTDGDGLCDSDDPCPEDNPDDTDGDGICDSDDGCPLDGNKNAPGVCGCGTPDVDTDGDLTHDCNDLCPSDPNKNVPGVCGCGTPDTDADGDGTPDCDDLCPNDPNKDAPGVCGCGTHDIDTDGDATPDCDDLCPNDPKKTAPGICDCGTVDTDTDGDQTSDCNDLDDDGDGVPDDDDEYPLNRVRCRDLDSDRCDDCTSGLDATDNDGADQDSDGICDEGDSCAADPNKVLPGICGCGAPDGDSDGDGVADCHDGCPDDPFKRVPGICGCGLNDFDSDGDGNPDRCTDDCPQDPNKSEPGACGCGKSDVDTDTDGIADCNDLCPTDPNKGAPGVCGCGTPDIDIDGDATPDCLNPTPLGNNDTQLGPTPADDPNSGGLDLEGCGVAVGMASLVGFWSICLVTLIMARSFRTISVPSHTTLIRPRRDFSTAPSSDYHKE